MSRIEGELKEQLIYYKNQLALIPLKSEAEILKGPGNESPVNGNLMNQLNP